MSVEATLLRSPRKGTKPHKTSFSQVMSPSSRINSVDRTNLLMGNGQATPILQGGNVSRRSMTSSHPALRAGL